MREDAYQTAYAADAPPPRTQRMPTIEELPRPAQEQLRQARGDANQAEARRRSLFERIAAFGASRQEEAYEAAAAQPAAPRPVRAQPPQAPQPSPMHAEYAKRASAQANAAAMRASADPQREKAGSAPQRRRGQSGDSGFPPPAGAPLILSETPKMQKARFGGPFRVISPLCGFRLTVRKPAASPARAARSLRRA